MEKIIEVGSWDSFQDNPVQLVKVSRRGLIGVDRQEFVKRAGHALAEQLDRIKIASDEIPLHILAVGATEGYGANRNGDSFPERACRKYYDTFVKHARFYKHHVNKDPAKSYGCVKLATYNEPMQRIELLAVVNREKSAAARNGGLVLDDASLARIERGDDTPVSMACRVPHDYCSICGKQASHRGEYCNEDTCRDPKTGMQGLGCKHGLTKLCEDGRQQYVDNLEPDFFDISQVTKPADRQAYGWRADYLLKAASEGIISGAELADLYAAQNGYTLLSPAASQHARTIAKQIKIAEQLAELEKNAQCETCQSASDVALAHAFLSLTTVSDFSPLGEPGTTKQANALAAIAAERIVLPFGEFVRCLSSGSDREKTAAASVIASHALPSVFSRLAASPNLAEQLRENIFAPSANSYPTVSQRAWASKLAEAYSLAPDRLQARVMQGVLKTASAPQRPNTNSRFFDKFAATAEPCYELARQYGLYCIAALAAMPENPAENFVKFAATENSNTLLTLRAVIFQNRN